ncbi:MAG TPA: phosphate signaling complex protein PhoU, partial [Holophaga sp.]|nr:phosphate signaling complex protein PhoU [Holophaga sp.]
MTTPNTPHLEAQLQRDIDVIRAKLLEMAYLDERALTRSLEAFLTWNRQVAYSVILRDQYVDDLETELDRLCLAFILRHQPAASHLRFVYSASKIVNDLERVGDYAESISRTVLTLSSMELDIPMEGFVGLANHAIPMLHNAVRAFVEGNPDLARATMANERTVRLMREALATDMVGWRQEARIPEEAIGLLTTITRRFERAMEQATNICEEAIYAATGQYLKHATREGFNIVFVDETNACLSQMAEAIAHKMGHEKLTFRSAGITSLAVDPQTIRFMDSKGCDLSAHTSKSVDGLDRLEDVQVVVALTPDAEKTFPLFPARALHLS